MNEVRDEQETIREYVKDIEEVAATLETGGGTCTARQEKFEELIDRFERTKDPIRQHMAKVMTSFLAGLFVHAPDGVGVLGGLIPRFQGTGSIVLAASMRPKRTRFTSPRNRTRPSTAITETAWLPSDSADVLRAT